MSEVAIDICEHTDERFFAAIKEARERGRLVAFSARRVTLPRYDRFKHVGYTSHGGTARVVVDVDDDVEEEPLFV